MKKLKHWFKEKFYLLAALGSFVIAITCFIFYSLTTYVGVSGLLIESAFLPIGWLFLIVSIAFTLVYQFTKGR